MNSIKDTSITLLQTLCNACDVDFEDEELAVDIIEKTIKSLKEQLQKERLKLNCDDPYNYVLTNPKGDTFTYNFQKGIGEELNDFLYGYSKLRKRL